MDNQLSLYPLKLNKDYYVAAANDLIKGKQKMTIREAQLLYLAMAQVVEEDKDFKTYTTTVPEIAEFMGIAPENLYRDIKGICKSLLQRVVEVKQGTKKWMVFQWVNSAKYDDGTLTLRLSDDIKPFMLELAEKGYFTKFQLGTVLTFRSYYTTRLYQFLKCECDAYGKDEWKFTCEELREFFQTGKKYDRNFNLINKTIKIAVDELNNSPYAHIWDFEEIKAKTKGNPITGVKFKALLFGDKDEKKETWLKYEQLGLVGNK
jgi:plasmid replication initiation protein